MQGRRRRLNVISPKINTKDLGILNAFDDEYNGVIIDSEGLPSSPNSFSSILRSSLSHWKQRGKNGVWLKIMARQAHLVHIAIKEGFVYHHAETGYVVLTFWLPDEQPCMLPSTGSHQIGIGAFVINENKEVLVVKEKKCPLRCSGVWKMPTGFIDKSEEIYLGAIREVKEETGIETEFLQVVAFRHAHFVSFEKSDLFFICMLKPLSSQITIDGKEIEDAKWMQLEDFLDQPFYKEDFMSKSAIEICIAKHEQRYKGFSAHEMMSKFDDRNSHLYYAE
ncbi:Nudix hydrolase [Zostera marina]|uniref:Nudix hydrolase n=1 Tax=Zostera marina TaxID=29655 RepID=A0A0K9NU40_ZOSMR|nr:Nudix hydrolase [Zostera marina]